MIRNVHIIFFLVVRGCENMLEIIVIAFIGAVAVWIIVWLARREFKGKSMCSGCPSAAACKNYDRVKNKYR